MMYAIHKRTKHHVAITEWNHDFWHYYIVTFCEDWNFKKGDDDGWIEWQGGECPLPDGALHEVKSARGEVLRSSEPEDDYWGMRHGGARIIAYRPILDADTKPEPPAWDGEGLPPVGCECEVRHLHSTDLEWRIIKITAITNDYVVGYIRDDRESAIRRGPLLEFRPIRSEEDRVVDQLMMDAELMRVQAERVYAAGYRKTGDT